ncbi:MAG: HAD-IIIC family phosphatase [Candidatus Scalindua sp. AMX11]|nr:MAG: HAD-IIIC family phosphatase [Candidatus Scalindua sp.]NOG83495.1 HAD-IIIC family phosphatase [Planctomycetota bacterium]RZV72890.1 MAG: HAD-IIIC family phosphatase [Candidatus Scalindua sp. SCAELEC01]TDE64812.1 MAG: HAD-IIIC family phosphatase [Candidatus Scalindua sp. AMX11]GJQ59806.1 MAG: hypothetical protein SCALA701_26070 [Candidatus Scalindua sp.]
MNVILVRFEDWLLGNQNTEYNLATKEDLGRERIKENVANLVLALKSAVKHSSTPYLVVVCPESPAVVTTGTLQAYFKQMEYMMLSGLEEIENVYLVRSSELMGTYPVSTYYDPDSNRLGHVPYTQTFYTGLGSMVARKLYSTISTPYKVVVLDCDQTIWKGVCGEDGPYGIEIDTSRQKLQEFMVEQHAAGMLLCLCSKNSQKDVMEVFAQRPEIPLSRDHLVSWRINWKPKSENIKSLADELQLGLDSFIFVDDNPVECAEVQSTYPQVLTLLLPREPEKIHQFLKHVWAFDHLKITEEDKQRTAMYSENRERERYFQDSLSLESFMAGLELKIEISRPKLSQLTRMSQLTQRTNQFNFTTIRYSETEIKKIYQGDTAESIVVEVSDRFGDYGLVGVIIFETCGRHIRVDTFLLSCRVLGKGVEHRMLNRLGEIAHERALDYVEVHYTPTERNQPALNFLEEIGSSYKQPYEEGFQFRLPTEYAKSITYTPNSKKYTSDNQSIKKDTKYQVSEKQPSDIQTRSKQMNNIAINLHSAEQIQKIIDIRSQKQREALQVDYVAPTDQIERTIANIWQEFLGVKQVGIYDNYFDLGGTSLDTVRIFAKLEQVFDQKLPLSTLFEAPTIDQLAYILRKEKHSTPWNVLVEIHPGGSKLPFFLMHAHGGNVLGYYDLSHHLGEHQPVYALQDQNLSGSIVENRTIEEMATQYIQEIKRVQPKGPYYLGGYCFGGVMAMEIAQQLKADGQAIALVVMIQAPAPGYPKSLPGITSLHHLIFQLDDRIILEKERFAKFSSKDKMSYISESVKRGKVIVQSRLRKLSKLLLTRIHKSNHKHSMTHILEVVARENDKAFNKYCPKQYNGQVVFFTARKQSRRIAYEPSLGWREFTDCDSPIHEIPCNRQDILAEPHIRILAEQLKIYLR